HETETDSGFTGVWRADTIRDLGGWDEAAYPNEDTELASRIREGGGRLVLVPEMAAQYTPRNSLTALWRQYWRYGRGRGRTARLHPISIRRSHALCPGLVLTLITAVGPLRRPRPAARAGVALYLAALSATAVGVRPRREAPFVGLVLVTMHVSWGAGYLVGITSKRPAVKPG
ncbi:MAG: glycosyltransferase family 2 protein, partial [Solirubrobacteraceae bacterium]